MHDTSTDPFQELRKIKKAYVDEVLKWYGSHYTWPRMVFRASGIVIIVSSLALPFLAANTETAKIGVPIASMLIAVLTGLNSFFGWQKSWEERITSKLKLEGVIAIWDTQMDAATKIADKTKAYEAALSATQDIIKSTEALTAGNTAQWFTQLKLPEVIATKNNS